METNFLDNIAFHENLKQSDVFGKLYGERFDDNAKSAFNAPLYLEIEEVLNHILSSYSNLSGFQIDILYNFFNALNDVRVAIDPDRLKPFKHFLNDDDELLLYRSTENGLINIIINPDECIAYSFIGTGEESKRTLLFYDENCDFENLVYKFFSY